MLISKIVGDFFITPSVNIQLINLSDDFRCGLVHGKKHLFGVCEKVSVRNRADPLALCLTTRNNVRYLAARIGNRHFVYKKIQLDLHPVLFMVLVIVHIIADSYNSNVSLCKILKFRKPLTGSSGESTQVFNDKYIIISFKKLWAKIIIVGRALLKGVSGFISVFVIIYRARRKMQFAIISDNCFLVFYTCIVSIKLKVNRYTCICGYF